jgi:hypothetical protein
VLYRQVVPRIFFWGNTANPLKTSFFINTIDVLLASEGELLVPCMVFSAQIEG